MPHLVILYTGNLESRTDVSSLCRGLTDAMLQIDVGAEVYDAKMSSLHPLFNKLG